MKKTKALVLFSGGLDSRLAIKLLQEQKNIEVEAVNFKLPFGGGCCNNFACVFNFAQVEGAKLHVIDCTKGKLFQEYLDIIKNPKHGTGTAMNPCKDCKIFLFKEAKKLAEEIGAEIIATGEVLGQRPMSQLKHSLILDEEKAGLKNKILRPLSAKLLPETEYEKQGLIDRSKLLEIKGRTRKVQMELAKKYKIKYPSPGGGCLLCEKDYCKKLHDLFKNKDQEKITSEEIDLLAGFRHFRNKSKIILGKNKEENEKLELMNKTLNWEIIIPDEIPGPSVIYENEEDKQLVDDLILAYSSKDLKKREKYNKYKI
mgnify:CR=1 FL=1|jgi:tRNA-uridine 2-sulfurtransferase